jgi:hypothetical protein
MVAMDRLLDDEDAFPQFTQGRFICGLLPKFAESCEAFEIFVAVQGHEILSAGFVFQQPAQITHPG